MPTALITGANGNIGTVLQRGLARPIRPFDRPGHDALDRDDLITMMTGCAAAIHLAWDDRQDNYAADTLDPRNLAMVQNVLRAAVTVGVPRVILASSIHADAPRVEPGGMRSVYRLPVPDGPYGAHKVGIEALGRVYAERYGLEVVCVRFGAINKRGDQPPDPRLSYPACEAWLSYRDCCGLVRAILDAPNISPPAEAPGLPAGYAIVYGVSNRRGGIHSLANPFGWVPADEYEARMT